MLETLVMGDLKGQKQAIDALHSGDCLRAVVRYAPYTPPARK